MTGSKKCNKSLLYIILGILSTSCFLLTAAMTMSLTYLGSKIGSKIPNGNLRRAGNVCVS